MEIEKGSGYFHIVEGQAGIVDLKYAEKKKQIQVRWKFILPTFALTREIGYNLMGKKFIYRVTG